MSKNKKADKKKSNWSDIWKRLKRNRMAMLGLVLIIILILSAALAPIIAPYGFDDQDVSRAFLGPSLSHLFGTDNLGRDVFSRILYGGRISLTMGLISVSLASVVGIFLGAVAGYYGGKIDDVIMRILDVLMAMPNILLAIAIAAALGPGLVNCMVAVGISTIPRFARVVRGPILAIRNQEYIEAATAVNASDGRIIFRHVLPNVLAPIIVQSTLYIANAVMAASSLSFLGMGVQPPSPEWGAMLSAGRQYIREYWHIVTFPGIAIMLTVFSLNVLGDGLRDALDPRLKN
ncbi:ABC transporter permease [Hominifimenecus sp. rT4P-3]|uniref:ABC transporter permease n=1 Tax=Hominifimenecus sp. rT4P-3 TaxID=3242979 RepID=UPI003DA23BF9